MTGEQDQTSVEEMAAAIDIRNNTSKQKKALTTIRTALKGLIEKKALATEVASKVAELRERLAEFEVLAEKLTEIWDLICKPTMPAEDREAALSNYLKDIRDNNQAALQEAEAYINSLKEPSGTSNQTSDSQLAGLSGQGHPTSGNQDASEKNADFERLENNFMKVCDKVSALTIR